ncbi:DUF6169 family protein [Fibrella aquatilis]|uniref:Uncharacterized protein n=1 Tax=Fibrella aquatilis TaxID=2817059 RepID=A0A939G1P9_9BACT|nr:DUF6169 family protein [Fibrella aquatilis]MBO0930394.1 hypothetical protein [Fibrella aquatilis]
MQLKDKRLVSYEIDSSGNESNLFYFTTDQDIAYEVRFKPSGYLFPDEPLLEPHVYEMVIALISNPGGKPPAIDPRIPPTIAAVFEQFMRVHERVVVYICESSDSRGAARQRKFSGWFEQYGQLNFVKIDSRLADTDGSVFLTSLILRASNPNLGNTILAFQRLIGAYSEGK